MVDGAGCSCNGGEGGDGIFEGAVSAGSGGAADLPGNVGGLGPAFEDDLAVGGGGECGVALEDPTGLIFNFPP